MRSAVSLLRFLALYSHVRAAGAHDARRGRPCVSSFGSHDKSSHSFAFLEPRGRSIQRHRRSSASTLTLLDHQHPTSSLSSRRTRTSTVTKSTINSSGTESVIGGIYRPFAEYAWTKLQGSGLFNTGDDTKSNSVPKELASNASPARGMPEGTDVLIEVKSMPGTSGSSPCRLARYALLETLAPSSSDDPSQQQQQPPQRNAVPNAIHVLNLVVFPNCDVVGCSEFPVLGLDLVTLPGNKHLVAIDFQPVLPLPSENTDDEGSEEKKDSTFRTILPTRCSHHEKRLQDLHKKYCVDSESLPWGGDIPVVAARFFSPYAVWTRLGGEDALDVVRNDVWSAFCDYVDLYIELMKDVHKDIEEGGIIINENDADVKEEGTKTGQRDYLLYRRDNDPARPMLKSLYGEEWTETLIGDVLFQMI